MNNTIPEMTDSLSRHWSQPDRSMIEVDDTHAVMTERTLNQLSNYSCSMPSGVYEGKMWRAEYQGTWLLRWYGASDKPDHCSNNQREILIA